MTLYARIENGVVVEMLDIDINPSDVFPPEYVWVEVTTDQPIKEKWRYEGGRFLEPLPEELDMEMIMFHVQNSIDGQMLHASAKIGALQDAVDLGMATEEEEALLLAWKRFRIEVSRVPQLPGFPLDFEWPKMPEGA